MRPKNRETVRVCRLVLVFLAIAAAPGPARGQSAWPAYPNNGAISVTTGGNVGIGTASPGSKLEVNSGTTGYVARLVGSGGSLFVYNSGAGNYEMGTSTNDGLAFDTNLATRMLITGSGNVGIGTTNPGSYKLAVEGNIGARDVIVTNLAWSDYVFSPGYRLRPLSEVAAYIQAHHHLPDIPSEAEVKEKGVAVGDMQARMLAKIEELTLHMIQEHERSDRLERQNQELREQIRNIQLRLSTRPAVPEN
ncbi:MAG TPA: hypothetical protein VMH28_28415 [Candidatus Acidoferrales bacterium]|nr:hypothetical protein [Candidatus Acidoferrales bacterium]